MKKDNRKKNDQTAKKLRVCAYARVSTDHEKQGRSLDNQAETYRRQITNNPDYEFAGLYIDKGLSGCSENRPELQRMMKDARAGKFDLIITKSVSRFFRNTVALIKYVRELKELGVDIYFEENNINTASSEGEVMLSVLASFAQEESRSMGENNKWAWQKKFERGEGMINTNRFLGYDKDLDGNLVINETEAATIRKIYDLYLAGYGTSAIAQILNEEGRPTVTGVPWRDNTVMWILKNEKYKGDWLLQKTYRSEEFHYSRPNRGAVKSYYVTEDHEAIIDPEDWGHVQELIAYRSGKRNVDKKEYTNRYPNSGMLICPYCGKKLNRRYVYKRKVEWICSTYLKHGKKACRGIRLREDALEGKVFEEPTVVEEVITDGSKHYRYTGKEQYDAGIRAEDPEEETGSSILPRVNRTRRTVIKL